MVARVFLSLGSNRGSREWNILRGVDRLNRQPGVRIEKLSSLYESKPVGRGFSRTFINAVCLVETDLPPLGLLDVCQETEAFFGREHGTDHEDRTLDIDIVLYNDISMNTDRLRIPHPRFRGRLFVLEPLAEIAPDTQLPPDGIRAEPAASFTGRDMWVRRISSRRIIRAG